MTGDILFADATSDYGESAYIILGIPKDSTGTHRRGTGLAPESIRKESYNFETYIHDLDVDLEDVPIHDLGNISEDAIRDTIKRIIEDGKVPIILGGEHSITPVVLSAFDDISVLIFDAHLDFRNEYEGDKDNHACSTRRIFDRFGPRRVLPVGVRSMCKEEMKDAVNLGLDYITVDEFINDVPGILKRIDDKLPGKVYISLDMDAIDPAYAPGVGTPEPFGLKPKIIRDVIRHLAPRVVGHDVVEVCPPFDNGNTASLAAKLIRDLIASRE